MVFVVIVCVVVGKLSVKLTELYVTVKKIFLIVQFLS